MQAGRDRGDTSRAAPLASLAGPTLLAGSGLILAASLFAGGGSRNGRLAWIGGAAVLLAGAAVAAALAGKIPLPRPSRVGWVFLGLLGAFVLWNGLTVAWSIGPDLSWSYLNRGLAYGAFVVLGAFVGAIVPRAPRVVAAGYAVLLAAVLTWSLAGKVIPDLYPDGARLARLRDPVEYWNVLALLAGTAVPLGLWLAAGRGHRHAVRAGGALLVYASVVVIALTYSRGGLAVALLVAAAWLAFAGPRLESMAALVVSLPFALAVSAVGFALSGVADDGQPNSVRVDDGLVFGAALLAGAAAVAGLAFLASRLEERRPLSDRWRRELGRDAAIAVGIAALVTADAFSVRVGNPVSWADDRLSEFTNPKPFPVEGPERLTTFHSNHRWVWWQEAWEAFEGQPLTGTGAGSFRLVHRNLRTEPFPPVAEPHSVPLQFLAETGLVGFLLLVGAAAAAVVAVVRGIRELDAELRPAAKALALGALAYPLHALVDFDWDFVAASAPLFLALGVLLAASRPPIRLGVEPLWGTAAGLVALTLVASLAFPRIADRQVLEAYAAIERDDPAEAVSAAREARSLNPLSVEPIYAEAAAEESRGDLRAALRLYVRAVELQPLNPGTWYELGRFELVRLEEPGMAEPHLARAVELDRFGPASDLLTQARAGA